MRKISLKKICLCLVLIILSYHVVFGGCRILNDFKSPMGSADNTIVAFGNQLRTGIFQETSPQFSDSWFMVDIQPEKQIHPKSGFIDTLLDENIYDYEVEMGWFYRYKMFYVYGRNGFWMIQADPFHIKLLRSKNIPARDAEALDETIAKYNTNGNQFTVVNDESGLTREERKAYNRLKEKAQPRIAKLKEQGLYP